MFCYQCEQTAKGTGCTVQGVCGKNPEVAALQELLIYALMGWSQVAVEGRKVGISDEETNILTIKATFSTLTNVDFDPGRFMKWIHETAEKRDRLADQIKAAGGNGKLDGGPATFVPQASMEELVAQGEAFGLNSYPVDDPDIGGYTVYRGDQPGNFTKIGRVKGYRTGAYLDKGKVFKPLEDGKTYYYKLVSFNLFNAEGEPTPIIQVTTKPRPVTARGLAVTAETEQITVKWEPNPESDIQKYTLYRNKNGGSWSKITELGGGQNNFHDKNLTPDVVYRYRVIVQDTDGLKSDPAESEPVKSPIIKTQ